MLASLYLTIFNTSRMLPELQGNLLCRRCNKLFIQVYQKTKISGTSLYNFLRYMNKFVYMFSQIFL